MVGGGGGGGGGGGWCSQSFSCKTQTLVRLGWVELWLALGFDKK